MRVIDERYSALSCGVRMRGGFWDVRYTPQSAARVGLSVTCDTYTVLSDFICVDTVAFLVVLHVT